MALAVEHQDVEKETAVITLRGKLMLGEAATQLENLVPELLKNGRKNLVFDLGGVTHIDSTGIGFLIAIYTSIVKEDGGKFVLASPNHRVREVLELTKLLTILPVYDSEAQALAALRTA